MGQTQRLMTTVLPGGRVEVTSPQLRSGDRVEVIIVPQEAAPNGKKSIIDILAEAPGHRLFQTVEEVDRYIHAERESWGR